MRIVLAYLPLKVRYNHGVSVLSAICREHGINTYIVPIEHDFDEKLSFINPEWVCFSFVCEHDYYEVLPTVERTKKRYKVMAGGVYIRKGAWVKPGLFDRVCRGEGERLPEFFLDGDESVFDGHLQADIDILPDYSQVSGFEFGRDMPFLQGVKIIPYSSSRGCPYKCNFCEVRFQPKEIRIKTTVKQDLDLLYEKMTPDLFLFLDELLPYYSEDWRRQMDGNKYSFQCYIRADIEPDHLQFLIDNGMKVCAFGVESTEEHRNKILGKGLTDQELFRTVEILNANRIKYVPFYMSGAPFETDEIVAGRDELIQMVGGFPIVWQHEEMGKKVFDIPMETLEKYGRTLGEPDFIDSLDERSAHINCDGKSFFIYAILPKAIFLRDAYGDGSWIEHELEQLCKAYGRKSAIFYTKRDPSALQRKYGFEPIRTMMSRDFL